MTPTSSSRRIRFVAECAALLTVSLALSYLDFLIPLQSLPLPGFKLGLANVAVVVALYRLNAPAAFSIAVLKSVVSSLLFSGITSLAFSLTGSVLSFIVLLTVSSVPLIKNRISFFGISIAMAEFHNLGQFAASVALMKSTALVYYLPYLLTAALIFGAVNGLILTTLPCAVYNPKGLLTHD